MVLVKEKGTYNITPHLSIEDAIITWLYNPDNSKVYRAFIYGFEIKVEEVNSAYLWRKAWEGKLQPRQKNVE